jgi:hypothetical protein
MHYARIGLIPLLSLLAIACGDASSEVDPTASSSSASSASSSSTSSSSGKGGSGGSSGSDAGAGGQGGSGGTPKPGPCDAIPKDTVGVIFSAPAHDPGLVGIAGWIDCPGPNSAVCSDTNFADPFPGSVAPKGNDVSITLFGTRPSGTRVRLIAGLYDSDATPAKAWFSTIDAQGVHRNGTYDVCVGKTRIGGDDGSKYDGAMSATDEAMSANSMATVP